MEDVKNDIGPKWPLEHYGVVACHLGQFNGAYLTGKPLPAYPWLNAQWRRSNVAQAAPAVAQLPQAAGKSLVRRAFPPDKVSGPLRWWGQREKFLDALDCLPRPARRSTPCAIRTGGPIRHAGDSCPCA
jgi:hypothetical protein